VHEFKVEMTCGGCSSAVEKVLGKLKGMMYGICTGDYAATSYILFGYTLVVWLVQQPRLTAVYSVVFMIER
jgi:hypothetical protein